MWMAATQFGRVAPAPSWACAALAIAIGIVASASPAIAAGARRANSGGRRAKAGHSRASSTTERARFVRILLNGGPLETRGHPFFEPVGANGRACVTCHQPSDGMSLAARTASQRWEATGGRDPLFAAYDGSELSRICRRAERTSHSLLLEHGLVRVEREWPPRDSTGRRIEPDFGWRWFATRPAATAARDYGPLAATARVSVYRRPRPVANLKYLTAVGFAYDPKQGMALPIDPATGQRLSGNFLADGRAATLDAQAQDAALTHLQSGGALPAAQLRAIVDFESRLFVAQQSSRVAGALDADGAAGGPAMLERSEPGQLGSIGRAVWSEYAAWLPAAAKTSCPRRLAGIRAHSAESGSFASPWRVVRSSSAIAAS